MIIRDNVKMVTQDDIRMMDWNEYNRLNNEQHAVFERLWQQVDKLLERFGRPDLLPGQRFGDYQVNGDYSDYPRAVVFVDNLKLLRRPVVDALQLLIKQFPGWQVDLMVTTRGHEEWPGMGVSVRSNEVVENLNRQYFPAEFQDLTFANSRSGTFKD
jgi:hypothetical protein